MILDQSRLDAKMGSVRNSVTVRILPTFCLVFLGYLMVGLCVSALPQFLHLKMGFSAAAVGAIFGLQYLSTLGTRNIAGRFSDTRGAKSAMQTGLLLCGGSGLLLLPVALLQSSQLPGIILLAAMRLLLGWGESYISTSGSTWGIDRVGRCHTAQVIAWSGVGSYGSLAAGAPLGQWIYNQGGIGAVGASISLLGLFGYVISLKVGAPDMERNAPQPSMRIFRKVLPFGVILTLSGTGFAALTSLVTLLFDERGWKNAPLILTIYGACFICVRILCGGLNKRIATLVLVCISLVVEAGGLAWLASSHRVREAFFAAALIGAGSSLVFPMLGSEAISSVGQNDRATALSLYTGFIDFSIGFTSAWAGLLMNLYGFRFLYGSTAVCALIAAAFCLVLIRRRRLSVGTLPLTLAE